ncbi:MAG: radical SAM family heme chaperone HemW [Ruminococcus sp.]|nr:radical SAM family heme chaperone HemW [Ruminococcus sp.]
MNTLGIYIHVPFCGKKCGYCDFYSVCYSKVQAELYVEAVSRNITHYSDNSRKVDTIYFGGGTPSLLRNDQLSFIIEAICNNFDLDPEAEITLEANPSTLTPEKLTDLRKAGINRLSIGVQSMCDAELKLLGRNHTSERASQAVYDAAKAGFTNISCDLMIGIPTQSSESLKESIKLLSELPIHHVSAYILNIEEGTPFDCKEIRTSLPDEDETAEQYLITVNELGRYGFAQYEVSNFARKGFESRHNSRYWMCDEYLGIGPAAHSCYKGKRFAVPRDIETFINSPVQPVTITDENPCGFEEYAMLRLRLSEGLSLSDVSEHRESIEKKLPPLIKAGYVKYDGEHVSLTPEGFLVSNSVIESLIF